MGVALQDVNLSEWDDRRLVGLAKTGKSIPARNILVLRYLTATSDLITRRTLPWKHVLADVDDARQEAVLWIIEAIDRYDVEHHDRRNGCSFRSFLFRVSNARLIDFVRRRGRARSRVCSLGDLPGDVTEGLPFPRTSQRADPLRRDHAADPAVCAERRETIVRLRLAVGQLDDSTRRLWDLLARGEKLRVIATKLEVSYDIVKRRRRKLLARLSITVRG